MNSSLVLCDRRGWRQYLFVTSVWCATVHTFRLYLLCGLTATLYVDCEFLCSILSYTLRTVCMFHSRGNRCSNSTNQNSSGPDSTETNWLLERSCHCHSKQHTSNRLQKTATQNTRQRASERRERAVISIPSRMLFLLLLRVCYSIR